jgi:uncharacterized protein
MDNDQNQQHFSRRSFVQKTSLLAGGMLLGSGAQSASNQLGAAESTTEIPQRTLGRTGIPLTTLTMGTAPCGCSDSVSVKDIADLVNAAIDEGITSIDTARKYMKAEEGVGLGLGRRRKDVFLATKVFADTIEEAEKVFSESLSLLKTDYVDLAYFHNLGMRDMDSALDEKGVFTWLVKQKALGKARFLGISGHNLPNRFAQFIETGEVDVLLCAMNFVDRHTYNFEETVLPLARKHKLGIVAMKVFGGMGEGMKAYGGPPGPPLVKQDQLELALRYALSLPGVTTANIGVHSIDQIRQNVEMVKRFQPLSSTEMSTLIAQGKQLAPKWGDHFGPAVEVATS